jgi:hypothetical protein
LTLNERQIILDAGKISHQLAIDMAEKEFEIFNKKQIALLDEQSMKLLDKEMAKLGKK